MTCVRDAFLTGVAVCYMIAFSSLYIQIPGLYGDEGIMPVKHEVKSEPTNLKDLMSQMSLIRYKSRYGLDTESAMDVVCLMGMAVSFVATITSELKSSPVFILLWILYMSLYSVGQTFLWFQWDILLLETGFLAILLAPMRLFWLPNSHRHDRLVMWLVKWLLFRLMYASGTVKLASECKTWWGLTALDWHFESQCIPTPLAWYFHHLPKWFLMFSNAMVFIIQIPGSFLFFVPIRNIRWTAFISQVLLQALIIATGNYNFFNLLTIVLCFSLIEDGDCKKSSGEKKSSWVTGAVTTVVSLLIYALIAVFSVKYFSLAVDDSKITSKIGFTLEEFKVFTGYAVVASIWIAIATFCWEFVQVIYQCLQEQRWYVKLYSLVCSLIMAAVVVFMFGISLVPHTVVDRNVQKSLPMPIWKWHGELDNLQIVNSYGLFRRMTGVGGRPEVVILGSNDLKNWQEYEFLYKPGDVNRRPPVVAPHQPRLDWQMWFAALGSYQGNIWLVRMVHQMFYNRQAVIDLIQHNPFPDSPPSYMKALLYTYHYTSANSTEGWWVREDNPREYLPVSTKEQVETYFNNQNIRISGPRRAPMSGLDSAMRGVRSMVTGVDHAMFVAGFLCLALVNVFIFSRISRRKAKVVVETKKVKSSKSGKHSKSGKNKI